MTSSLSLRIVDATEQDIPLLLQFIRELAHYEKLIDQGENNEDLLRKIVFADDSDIHALIAY